MSSVSMRMLRNSISNRNLNARNARQVGTTRRQSARRHHSHKARKSVKAIVLCASLNLQPRSSTKKKQYRAPPPKRQSRVKEKVCVPSIEDPRLAEYAGILGKDRLRRLQDMFRLIDADDSKEIEFEV